jgi:hypothetical protein
VIPEGYVAVRSTGSRVLLHLAAPPYGEHTVCGRYNSDRYLPDDTAEVDEGTRTCEVCLMGAAPKRAAAPRRGAQ